MTQRVRDLLLVDNCEVNHACMCLTEWPSVRVQAHGQVDPDGSRYLLGDHAGNLLLLVRGCACPVELSQDCA